MLLVMRWLEEGAGDDGELDVDVAAAAEELELEPGRPGIQAVMAALGELEDRGQVTVTWPAGPVAEGRVTLSDDLRRDARRLFGRT